MAVKEKKAKAAATQAPTVYAVFQVAADAGWHQVDGEWPSTRGGAHACALAAAKGESDGKPKNGTFVAVPVSRITAQHFTKKLEPSVDAVTVDVLGRSTNGSTNGQPEG